jgi:outer membrane protein TolC
MQLTLPQAIDLALKQNRSLKLGRFDVVDSEQKKKIAQACYFPRVKNESTVLHITALEQLVIPEGSLEVPGITGPIPSKPAIIGQGDFTGYTSGTGLSQPLTQMFKVHQENRAASLDAKQEILKQSLQVRDLTFQLNNMVGLPLNTKLQLSEQPFVAPSSTASRDDGVRIAREQSDDVGLPKTHISRI